MSEPSREQWSGRIGFLLAAIGSAVGLGNMWRFSYLAAENGGAAFVILYLILTASVGLPVLLAELVMGRGAKRSPISALAHFGGVRWKPLGLLFVASGFLILSYYGVIAGWTVRYALEGLIGGFGADPGAHFQEIATGPFAIFWHVVFMSATIAVVAAGVKAGIERTSLVLMPALFFVVCGIALYAYTLPGSAEGYAFYLEADFSKLLDPNVINVAAGQAFFSLSLGMGAMMTYASYLSPEQHLPNESLVIGGADFAVAFIVGLAVFPLIFALGLSEQVGESTVGALFITLPHAFAQMGEAGRTVGVLFFAALVVGAFTSAVSLLEVVTASAMDSLGWTRARAAIIFGGVITLLGFPAALHLDVLDWMDKLAGNLFLILGGLLLSIFVGWIMADPVSEAARGAHGVRWFRLWRTLLRYPVPLILAFVLYSAIRGLWLSG
ncbi:MAG: sodium-dependent transporter [Myxococcota bacterium]